MKPGQKTVSIQGQSASYHDIARRQYFGNDSQVLHRDSFREVFADIKDETADFGIVAIENSLYGSINEVYDLLVKHNLNISGELYLHISHCLLGVKGASIDGLKEVHSQIMALGQCDEYLETTLKHVERIERHDTAASAAEVAKLGDPTKAAIASAEAAELHGLTVLAREIETNKHNYTRFIVLTKEPAPVNSADKTSIVLEIADTPGALYSALGVFTNRGINLSKLESRPIVGKAWHYIFYIDFEAGVEAKAAQAAIAELEELGNKITHLGSYLKAENRPI